MAKRDTEAKLKALGRRLRPDLKKAFLELVANATRQVQLKQIENALRIGDTEAVVRALQVGPELMGPLVDGVERAFRAGGDYEINGLPPTGPDGQQLVFAFQGRHPRAELYIQQRSSTQITLINAEIRQSVKDTIQEGLALGRGPRRTALDIAGRVDPSTGRRRGGVVGLSGPQSSYVRNMRRELETGDLPGYLRKTKRNRQFDPMVKKALSEGRRLPAATVDKITGAYSDRLLLLRAETIARTESIGALNAGRIEAMEQLVDSGKIEDRFVRKIWHSTGDERTRDWHEGMDGDSKPKGESFVSPKTGATLLHPGDTTSGAPGADVINCRCWMEIVVDWIAARREARANALV